MIAPYCIFCSSGVPAEHCDVTNSVANYNGNDALEVVCGGSLMDSIGTLGGNTVYEDPSGTLSTEDHTLTRECSVFVGDRDSMDAYQLIDWTGMASIDFTGLGEHCP